MPKLSDIKRFLKNIEDKHSIGRGGYNPDQCVENIDGSFSFSESVNISLSGNETMKKFPIKIDSVYGQFECIQIGLVTLKNGPKYVNGNFNCNGNPISTLEGGPIEINGSYFCSSTNIKNLKGCPEKIRGSVFCNNNRFLYDIIDIPYGCTHIYMNGCPIQSIFNIFCHSNNNGGFEFVGSTTMKNLHSKINPKYLIRCLNDYEVIREDNISKYRFNQMFEELTDEKGEFKFSKELLNQYTIVE